jgi:hypothetical protein
VNATAKYVGLYTIYCIGIDALDRNTDLLQKQTGFYGKAENFPYFDAWSLTHILWGVIASKMNVSFRNYMILNVSNEVLLEQFICRYAKNNKFIHFSKQCDSIPHQVADILFGTLGYLMVKK